MPFDSKSYICYSWRAFPNIIGCNVQGYFKSFDFCLQNLVDLAGSERASQTGAQGELWVVF